MAYNADCIFCEIARGEIPAKELYRDRDVIAIADLNPQAPAHLLVLPKEHYADVTALYAAGAGGLAEKLFEIAAKIGSEHGARGFRLVVNTGVEGGQTVDHVHVHVLAGRHMRWPPG
jgi:histidine triad (HIT) family protein